MFKRIISFVLVIAIVFCFAVPSAFAITEYRSKATNIFDIWFTYWYNNADDVWDEDSPLPWLGTAIKGITTALNSKICEQSHDGYHASLGESISHEAFGMDEHGRYCFLSCDYCGEWFRCYSSDLIAAYDEYVASLDSTTAKSNIAVTGYSASEISSSTKNGVTPLNNADSISTVRLMKSLGVAEKFIVIQVNEETLAGLFFNSDGLFCSGYFTNPLGVKNASLFGVYDLAAIDILESKLIYYQAGGSAFQKNLFYDKSYAESWADFPVSECYAFDWDSMERFDYTKLFKKTSSSTTWSTSLFTLTQNVYSAFNFAGGNMAGTILFNTSHSVTQPTGADVTTRTGSLMQTINNYNVDNSVVDNSSNVNYYISPKSYVAELPDDTIDIEQCYSPQSYDEETLVFTEPVTGAQILTSGWTYNYETRTYDIAVPAGTTTDTLGSDVTRIELIYGDEAVTYNYYLADDTLAQSDEYAYVIVSGDETFGTGGSSGDDNTGDDSTGDAEEETHKHSYTDTVTTEPTCEAPGIRKYTCDECGDSYTEKIDAAGHTWTVKKSVATEYDDTGAVTVQGYTIYKCSVCNTEYKDEAGTGPPNNSADNTDGEGIFKKIGQLLGSILSGLLGMIEAVLGGLLDGLVRLANLLGDKLTRVVEIVMGLFDKIPQLFGGFTALLSDVFVFIPEDIMTIFTFGAAAIVFVGILMFFIKR